MRVVHRHQSEQMHLELSVSDDKLKLFAKVVPQARYSEAQEEQFTEELLKITQPHLIETLVVQDIVKELREGRGCDERRVAKGEAPTQGRDGKLVWLVRRFRPGAAPDHSRELTDFYHLGLFENIEVDQEVARVYRPTSGAPGVDVFGREISTRAGRAYAGRFDKTLKFKPDEQREDYQTVLAAVAGYAHEESNKVTIKETLVVPGNLDYEMGHIDFVGSVRVGGDVQKGFHIKARGEIDIQGSVLGDSHLTSDASITVKGFHQGGDSGIVKAKMNYTVSIAQGVTAEVGGTITVTKEARDCSFRASVAIIASQASVIGGSMWCVKGFEGKTVGNPAGVRTVIEIRNELECTAEYRRIEESIKKHEAALAALELHIGPYLKNRKRVPLLATKFRLKISELINRFDSVQASMDRLQSMMKTMRESKPPEENSRVNVLGTAYPGVSLHAASGELKLNEEVKGPASFKPKVGQEGWTQEGYQPLLKG